MFSFFKRKPKDTPAPPPAPQAPEPAPLPAPTPVAEPVQPAVAQPTIQPAPVPSPELPLSPSPVPAPAAAEEVTEEIVPAEPVPAEQKKSWLQKLKSGLSKTSANLTTLFVGAKIDDDLYEELESALLVSDAGVEATQFLLDALKKKVKAEKLTEAQQVKTALRTLLIEMLAPLQKPLVLGRHQPLVMMITGVNGAGKTTTIGKL
ncbi:MAG TPA: signal recognition particle receptor subunit alpha, partial [Noviherbaspirillum sp.]